MKESNLAADRGVIAGLRKADAMKEKDSGRKKDNQGNSICHFSRFL